MTSPDATPPRSCPGVTLRRSDDGNVIADAHGSRLCVTNDTGAALWELCDGRTTIDEMVAAVRQLWRVDPPTALGDVRRALTDLARAGAIDWPDAAVSPAGGRAGGDGDAGPG